MSKINKLPFVSVVIPVYNEEKYILECLTSLDRQTYSGKEIIVVDDGSTDASLQICRQFKIKIIEQLHLGPGAARNLGVKFSKGEVIVFADADMRYKEDYIEKLIEPILQGKAIGTFVKQEYVANPENIWARCWSVNSGLPYDRRLPVDYREYENAFRAILKSYFLKGGGFDVDEGYSDDSSLSRKIKKFAVNAKDAVSYHYNPTSLNEVFYSARWIGRSKLFKPNLVNFLRYLPVNSLRIAIRNILRGAPLRFIFFKLIYDLGMFCGIFLRFGKIVK